MQKKLSDLFHEFGKAALDEENLCLITGGSYTDAGAGGTSEAVGTCDIDCCKETAGSDTTTDDVCTGDQCDPDDGPDYCV